jgi:NTE family protein
MPVEQYTPTPIARDAGERPVALVLGAGGAHGLAHIGVLKVLRAQRVPIDLIVGASMGSLIGAGLAAGYTPEQMERDAARTPWLQLFTEFDLRGPGLLKMDRIRGRLDQVFGDLTFDRLQVPLAVVAASFKTGALVVLREGRVADAVLASIAIPLIFPPVPCGEDVLVDGGVLAPVPVEVARQLGARRIIAVDAAVDPPPAPLRHPRVAHLVRRFAEPLLARARAAGRLTRSAIACFVLYTLASSPFAPVQADVVIKPSYGRISMNDYHRADQLVRLGELAAWLALPQLRSLGER